MAKIVTCFQIEYIVLQYIGRYNQRITITTTELSTLAIVIYSIMTSLCWMGKPLDVRTPIRISLNTSLEQILKDAGPVATKPYRQIPLDFVDDLRPSWALNVQTFMGRRESPIELPVPRFGNDRFPNLTGWQELILCVCTVGYAAIHLLGWNFTSPTNILSLYFEDGPVWFYSATQSRSGYLRRQRLGGVLATSNGSFANYFGSVSSKMWSRHVWHAWRTMNQKSCP